MPSAPEDSANFEVVDEHITGEVTASAAASNAVEGAPSLSAPLPKVSKGTLSAWSRYIPLKESGYSSSAIHIGSDDEELGERSSRALPDIHLGNQAWPTANPSTNTESRLQALIYNQIKTQQPNSRDADAVNTCESLTSGIHHMIAALVENLGGVTYHQTSPSVPPPLAGLTSEPPVESVDDSAHLDIERSPSAPESNDEHESVCVDWSVVLEALAASNTDAGLDGPAASKALEATRVYCHALYGLSS